MKELNLDIADIADLDIELKIKNLDSITIELSPKEYEEYLLWKKRKSKKIKKIN